MREPILVYRPTDARRSGPAPMVLDVPGGAWTWIDAAADAPWCEALADAGFVVVSVSHRAARDAPWPAALDDVRAAARWMRDHADELGGDPSRLAVVGNSSGAHSATLLALEDEGVGAVAALWPVVDPAARFAMLDAYRMPAWARPLAPWFEQRAGRRAGRRTVGRHGAWAQAVLAARGLFPPWRELRYRRLRHAHDLAFPEGVGQMRAASTLIALAESTGPLPPLLVVHAGLDVNTTAAASGALVDGWRAAGGRADLARFRWSAHGFGTIRSGSSERLGRLVAGFLSDALGRPLER